MARTHRPEDSLDLLLDTMCNAFGGIIMIAILVALLAKDPKDAPNSNTPSAPDPKAIRIAQQINDATKLNTTLKAQLPGAGLIGIALKTREGVTDEIKVAEQAVAAATMASDRRGPDGKPDPVAALQGQLALLQVQEQQLQTQLTALGQEAKDNSEKRKIVFKPPPPAQRTEKAPLNLIFRHDRMYQVEVNVGGSLTNNKESIRWIGPGGIEAEPIPEKGIDPDRDKAATVALIRSLPAFKQFLSGREPYVAALVYADSFRAYLQFKQLFLKENTGLSQGWQPLPHMNNLRVAQGNDGIDVQVQGK